MKTDICFDDEFKEKMFAGMKKSAEAVISTLGPAGRTVIMETPYGDPLVSKDGVTVAKAINLPDPVENMGAQLIKSMSSKTNDIAGDGTTTTIAVAIQILEEGLKTVNKGINPIKVRDGINFAVKTIVDELKKMSQDIETKEQIMQVAAISANNDPEIGAIIAEAIEKVGSDGVITVEESKTIDTHVDFVEGMQFDRGYISPYFCTDPDTMTVKLDEPYILIYDKKISATNEILPILDATHRAGKPLLIIAEDVEGDALMTMVTNNLRGVIQVCAIKAPGFGERKKDLLEDIAALTGGDLINEEIGMTLPLATIDNLGIAKSITVTKNSCTIVDGYGDRKVLEDRISKIKKEITSASDYEKEKLQERLAKLAGGVAVINIGAVTEVELKEKKHRVEDSVNSTRAAIEEGIVAGGGTALVKIANKITKIRRPNNWTEDNEVGYQIVAKAITKPLRQIVENAGSSPEVILEKVKSSKNENYGYNALTGKYINMVEGGIIDPVKVTRSAVENAASIASLILTSNCAITTIPEPVSENK